MSIGAFSVSLNVKDIVISKSFYEKIGFQVFHGDIEQKWLIMKNKDCTIGLFEGMLDNNILTFNPGWDNEAKEVDLFKDIRELQKEFREKGIQFESEVDESSKGPGSFVICDPDGNTILVDQHR